MSTTAAARESARQRDGDAVAVDQIVQYTPEEGGRHGSHRAHGETA